MALKTAVDKDFIDTVLVNYNVGKTISWRAISTGYANDNFNIVTADDSFLFRICREQKPEMVAYEIKLMHLLKESDFPTAFPLPRKDGAYITPTEFGSVVIYEFKEGVEPRLNENTVEEIAVAIAKLNALPNWESHQKTNVINIPDCLVMIENFKEEKYQYPEIYSAFKDSIYSLIEPLKISIPKGIIHGDCFPDNTLYLGDKLNAIVDFEEANVDNLLFDVGMTLNGFCFENNELDYKLYKTFMVNYNAIRPLTHTEWEVIYYYIQWCSVGMAYWHLRHLIKRPFEKQKQRVEELLSRAAIFRDQYTPYQLNLNK